MSMGILSEVVFVYASSPAGILKFEIQKETFVPRVQRDLSCGKNILIGFVVPSGLSP